MQGLSGRGYAGFQASVNFAFTAFYEVRVDLSLRTPPARPT